ncbi:DUF1127 domain-containing protein [Methylobacterium sp. J-076]|uniref:DUF1127 domain-containing protein n=1 Tax=Methylobacterium sp. J-076 TaxID=2836655 RepID=UPI001FBAFA3F|nr:DUF1127 domain-containing protein [Methylobacterium sp. J-076]MCJ2012125.1 DUF1127 domain-containing protein [Methylobacterium sp. J-076]
MGTGRRGIGGFRRVRRLGRAVSAFAVELRADLGRPAMNRRILHRLAGTGEGELSRLGLTERDLNEAAAPEVADVAGFLAARRDARRAAPPPSRR